MHRAHAVRARERAPLPSIQSARARSGVPSRGVDSASSPMRALRARSTRRATDGRLHQTAPGHHRPSATMPCLGPLRLRRGTPPQRRSCGAAPTTPAPPAPSATRTGRVVHHRQTAPVRHRSPQAPQPVRAQAARHRMPRAARPRSRRAPRSCEQRATAQTIARGRQTRAQRVWRIRGASG